MTGLADLNGEALYRAVLIISEVSDETRELEAVRATGAEDYLLITRMNTAALERVLLHTIERQLTRRRTILQYSVSSVLAESETLPSAAAGVLRAPRAISKLDFGELWQTDPVHGRLVFVQSWHDPLRHEFASKCQTTSLSKGQGLAGRAWEGGAVLWEPNGHKLSPDEQARSNEHPLVARDLLSKTPRLEPIAWMITHQNDSLQIDLAEQNLSQVDIVSLGSQILKTSLAFDQLLTKGLSVNESGQGLRNHPRKYAPILVSALKTSPLVTKAMELKTCAINELRIGMVLQEEVRTVNGMLVVAKGQEITPSPMPRLQNFWEKKSIGNNILVMKRKTGVETEPSLQPAAPALRH